ncbi:Angiopoietin-related protein 3 [Stylophora pistillata]|uniref:Angiopoietin-related protein 3 n=1 Tax=Stylophora pistillata TaxID=50429 RepID=A0A2B4SA39_STYPI|nr:Angiopoietin-related protein 3 [Stylophora pistillata]
MLLGSVTLFLALSVTFQIKPSTRAAPIDCKKNTAVCLEEIIKEITQVRFEVNILMENKTLARAKNCAELYKSGRRISGVYAIDPDGLGAFNVYCDQTTAGGGWAVFQRRLDGSFDFNRTWNDYKHGFGNLVGEFWLGLDKINRLTRNETYNKLRVDLGDKKDRWVITATPGNHGIALAFHCQALEIPVHVVLPEQSPLMKQTMCKKFGANIIIKGKNQSEAREFATSMAAEKRLAYIDGMLNPKCPSFQTAMSAGHPIKLSIDYPSTLTDALNLPEVGKNAFHIANGPVDKLVAVSDDHICLAVMKLQDNERAVTEGSGAAGVAALLGGYLPQLEGKRIRDVTQEQVLNDNNMLILKLLKDYGEASCSGASVEPIKDTDLFEPLSETETRIEREFVDVGTQVELVTTETEVQCEITNTPFVPTCSTPLCSPVKSVGGHSDDNQEDLDCIPKYLIPAEDLVEEEVEKEEKNQTTLKKIFRGHLTGKKGSEDPQRTGKKVDALAKQKDCENAGLWRKSIINHLYWMAATAPEGDEDMLEAMRKSVINHIQDIRDGHSELYRKCAHGDLDDDDRDKEWLQPCYTETPIEMLLRDYEENQGSLKNSIQDMGESMPALLADSFEKPCKETAVKEFVSRFAQR